MASKKQQKEQAEKALKDALNAAEPEGDDSYIIAADTMGRDILAALVQEVKALPDVWEKLSQERQGNVIDRLRRQVENIVGQATEAFANAGSATKINAEIEGVNIKGGIKVALKVGRSNETHNLDELFRSVGEGVLLVLVNREQYTGGMDQVQPSPDQRSLLGDSIAVTSNDEDNHW